MAKCYKCEVELTYINEADEHVILNACGGRLKSKKLLCKVCNSTFGGNYDAELARQTNSIANQLLIKRHNGAPQPIEGILDSSNKKIKIPYGKKPIIAKPVVLQKTNTKNTSLSIEARDWEDLREILKGLKKKNPNIDIEDLEKKAEVKYLNEPIHLEILIGGDVVFRSIAKSAISYFILKGGLREHIKHLLPYLEGKDELDVVWFHYPEELIYTPDDGEVSHVIRLMGNPDEKILYVYIELFNAYKYIVTLNDDYDGNAYDETYIFDLINIREINRNISLIYSRKQLINIFDQKQRPYAQVQKCFKRIVGIAQGRQYSNCVQQSVTKAFDNILGKYPDNIIITQEMIDNLLAELMKKIQEDLL